MEAGGVVQQSEAERIMIQQGKKPPYETLTAAEKKVIYISVATGMFLAAMDMNVVVVALPSIVKDLGQPELFTWIMASYMLTSSAVMVLYGRFSDVYGRRVVFLFAVGVFTLGSALCGAATSLWFLIIARGVAGIGGGGLQSLGLTIVGDVTEPAKRPGIIAGLSSIGALSSLLGPLVGGGITDSGPNGWRWIFYVNMPFCAIAFISSWIAMRHFELPVANLPVDVLGAFLIASSCICIVLFVLWGGSAEGYPWDSGVIIGLICASVVLLVLFILQELRHPLPIIELKMFRIRNVAVIMPLIFFIGVQMFAAFTFLPVYFQQVMMESALMSGVKLFPLVGTFLLGAGVASGIMQKTGKIGFLIPLGSIMLTTGLGLLSLLHDDTNYGDCAGYMVLFGLGIGMIFALVSVTLQNSVEAQQMGVVMSAFAFFQLLGGSLGVAIVGALMNHWSLTYIMETPMDPLGALCKALDNVFISTLVPGSVVIVCSFFIKGVKVQHPDQKHVEEMNVLEMGNREPAKSEQGQDAPTEIQTHTPAEPHKESETHAELQQRLEDARQAIERQKSRLQGMEQEARDLQQQLQQQHDLERPKQAETPAPVVPSAEELEKRAQEEQLRANEQAELERRAREEEQVRADQQRATYAMTQRKSEVLARAELALSTDYVE